MSQTCRPWLLIVHNHSGIHLQIILCAVNCPTGKEFEVIHALYYLSIPLFMLRLKVRLAIFHYMIQMTRVKWEKRYKDIYVIYEARYRIHLGCTVLNCQ